MAKLFNRAKVLTATTGTGTITLGDADGGYLSFADAGVVNGDVVRYVIEEGDNFEIGAGTYSSTGPTLTRNPSQSSEANDAKITLAGEAVVFITATKEDFVNTDGGTFSGNVDFGNGIDVTGNITVTGTVDGRDIANDGSKLDNIESNATADQTAAEIRSLVESATNSNVFTDADHNKLNGIADSANNYSLPLASPTARGGVKTGYAENGKNYPVELSNEKMFVNVPWTDTNTNTTYSFKAQATDGNNTNPNLFLDASTGTDDTVKLVGSGATTVTRNGDGQITISSTDTNTDTNTTYSFTATQTDSNNTDPNLYLNASAGTDYNIQIVGDGATTVTRNSATKITISSTDTNTNTNTTYSMSVGQTSGTNADPNLNLVDSSSTTDAVQFTGTGATSVARIDDDTIQISSTDTNTTYSAGTNLSLSGTTFNVVNNPSFSTSATIDGHVLQDSADRSGLLAISTDLGSWNGIQIQPTTTSKWSIMGDQDDFGLYDDENNEWILLYNENSTLSLYSNGTAGLTVGNSYIDIPSQIRHMGDTDTYLQFHGNDTFRIVIAGAEVQEWGNNYTLLSDNDTLRLGSSSDFRMWFDGTNTYFRNYSHSGGDVIFQGEGSGGTNQTAMRLDFSGTASYVQLYENGSERLRTLSGGVGVTGLTVGDVDTNPEYSGSLMVANSEDNKITLRGSSNPYISFQEASTTKAYMQWNSGGYFLFRNREGGKFTFRPNGPTDAVHVRLEASDGDVYGSIYATHDNDIGFLDDDDSWAYRHRTDSLHEWRINNTVEMDLDSSALDLKGNNLEGVTDIYVADQIIHTGDTNTYLQFDAADSWRVVTGGAQRVKVQGDNVIVNGAIVHNGDLDTYTQFHNNDQWRVVTGGGERLEVNSVQITAAVKVAAPEFIANSDINLKENIVQIDDALSKLNTLNGYTYNFIDNPDAPQAGLIAQEVQKVLPEVVQENEDGNLGLNYNGTIALLVEAIKDQQRQIDELTRKLEE